MPMPFQQPSPGGHILGQPFTLSNLSIPVNATLACNCAMPPTELHIVNSVPAECPVCQKTYLVTFNPQNGQLMVAMAVKDQKAAS